MNDRVPSVTDSRLPTFTVIIPARPEQNEIKAAAAARQFDYPRGKFEVIIARGKQPSVQRNSALREAKGELICFLDDDSVAPPDHLRKAAKLFEDPSVKMAGGPNLCPSDAPPLEQAFSLVLGSELAFGPSRARYTRVGTRRASSEKELILCNLCARRDLLIELGGFDEALYPNEENALMDGIQQRGGVLLYDPDLAVQRRPRSSLKAFAKMLRTYGRGRAEQFRAHPTFGSLLNFVPPLFCVYLLAMLILFLVLGPASPIFRLLLLPLGLYVVAVLAQTTALALRGPPGRAVAAIPLIVLTHILYGLGFWRGLFTPLKPPGQPSNTPVTVERVV